jgi:dTDP-4-amino-4,6-dideoxygalactose transaminase
MWMIPLHRPYFGIGTVIASSMRIGTCTGLSRLEQAYAEAADCKSAVWLPSGRAGICWALRSAISPGTTVVAPAFTCTVVHEAIARSGGRPRLVDAADDDFLMDPAALSAAERGEHATVLSEPYGHTYDLLQLAHERSTPPTVQIVDMAMAVPSPDLFQRLGPNDFGLISFGNGKSMYAGWGAIGFTQNRMLAEEVRKIRDSTLAKSGLSLIFRRALKIGLRTAAHYPPVYSLAWQCWYRGRRTFSRVKRLVSRRVSNPSGQMNQRHTPPERTDERAYHPEWLLPSTHLDRALAMWNLERAESVCHARVALARRYDENLTGGIGIIRPKKFEPALSHYTVRVNSKTRDAVKKRLFDSGIYTISLWTLPPHVDGNMFPNASRLSSEVINLPLSPWMTIAQVDHICATLKRSVQAVSHL